MNSHHRRQMRAARERDYIAWEPDDPEPWQMQEVSLQQDAPQRGAQSDAEISERTTDER